MNELERCYESKLATRTWYIQQLTDLDLKSAQAIENLLQQKEVIRLKLEKQYRQKLQEIDKKIQLITQNNNNNQFNDSYNTNHDITTQTTEITDDHEHNNINIQLQQNVIMTNRIAPMIDKQDNLFADMQLIMKQEEEQAVHNQITVSNQLQMAKENINQLQVKKIKVESGDDSMFNVHVDNNKTSSESVYVKLRINENINENVNSDNSVSTIIKSESIDDQMQLQASNIENISTEKEKQQEKDEEKDETQCKVTKVRMKDMDVPKRGRKPRPSKWWIRVMKNGETKYQCRNCDKIYSFTSSARIHFISNHTKKFECKFNDCNKCFGTKARLVEHERIHTNDAPFECKVCKRLFRSRAKLITHLRVHTGEKAYKCRYCEKRFSRSDNRRVHERVHTGIKPYKCKYCDKRFSTLAGAKTHQKRRHSV